MKLLFDQNLSPRLVELLADYFPGSAHVYSVRLDCAPNLAVWNLARNEKYVIVTQDSDFGDLSTLFGFPPRVVWIRRGNCSTKEIEAILRFHYRTLIDFASDPISGVLALF